jgi:hypothetical protein
MDDLLAAGARADAKTKASYSPLHIAASKVCLPPSNLCEYLCD